MVDEVTNIKTTLLKEKEYWLMGFHLGSKPTKDETLLFQ